MGSDIHLFIEYRVKNSDAGRWNSFAGQIELERDYRIFARLAGVRGELANAMVPPRGFPADSGPKAKDENLLWIDYSGKEPDSRDSACTPDEAKQWVAMGKSKYFGKFNKVALAVDQRGDQKVELVAAGGPERVSQPDWHSHSWLGLEELETAIRTSGQDVPKTYAACIAAMRSLEKAGCDVRVVFWFDN